MWVLLKNDILYRNVDFTVVGCTPGIIYALIK